MLELEQRHAKQLCVLLGRAPAVKGFLVVIPDYRLVLVIRCPVFLKDGAAAVRWTERHAGEYGGTVKTLLVMEHSAGAYIAAMLAVDRRWLGPDWPESKA